MSCGCFVVILHRIKYYCKVMKKVLFFAVIVFCAFSASKAQDIVNLRMDRQQMGLRGNVASMNESLLLRKDYFREDWPQRKWFIQDLRSVLREEDGRVVTFNPAGRMVTVSYSHQGKMGPKTQCVYASNGLLTSFTGEGYKIEARYKGNLADVNVYAETKSYAGNVDIARANLKDAQFTYSYPFDLKCRQEYSDDGLLLRSSYYYVDSMIARDCEYNYNHNNLMTSEKMVDYTIGEKTVSNVKYEYDNKGFLVKKTVHSKAVDATFTYENNELGDCTKMTVERPYGTIVYTFEYRYDNEDNWTVRLEYEDGVFDNATVRSFSYHSGAQKNVERKADSGKQKGATTKKASKKTEKQADKKTGKKTEKQVDKKADKESSSVDKTAKAKAKSAEKEAKAAEKAAKKNADAQQKEAARAEKERKAAAEKNMSKEERKAAQAAEKEAKAQAKAAEKEKAATERAAANERKAAEKQAKAAEKERIAAEKAAEKERKAAEKAAEKERKAAEKEQKSKK